MSRMKQAQSEYNRLAQLRREHNAKVQAIKSDDRFAPEYKEKLISEATGEFAGVAKVRAGMTWRAVSKAADAARADLIAASKSASAAVDEPRVAAKIAIYKAEIEAAQASANPVSGRDWTDAINERREQLQRIGDNDALMALRLAATPALNRVTSSDETMFPKAARLLSGFKDDELAAAPDVTDFEQEANELEHLKRETRRLILDTESTATGAVRESVFSTISPWQRDVLGESYESTGAVVWKTSAAAVASD